MLRRLGEAGDGFSFSVVNIEDGQQFGDLEHFLELAAEVAEPQRSALRLHAVMRGDERARPALSIKVTLSILRTIFFFLQRSSFLLFRARRCFPREDNAPSVPQRTRHPLRVRHLQGTLFSSSSESGSGGNRPEP